MHAQRGSVGHTGHGELGFVSKWNGCRRIRTAGPLFKTQYKPVHFFAIHHEWTESYLSIAVARAKCIGAREYLCELKMPLGITYGPDLILGLHNLQNYIS
jgi:hypothetical protein